MFVLKQVQDLDGNIKDVSFPGYEEKELDCEGLTIMPALIDPHVHFRTPGAEYKEDWFTGAEAAVLGGVTTVFDMPNNTPSCITRDRLLSKKRLIESQLQNAGIPLHFELYFGADKRYLDQIPLVKDIAVGIKVFMGSSTGSLLVDDDQSLHQVFGMAAETDQIVSVHAEDEPTIKSLAKNNQGRPSDHSRVRSKEAAIKASEKAIALAEKYGTRLCILHMSTQEELEMIKAAKMRGVQVFAEVSPHHLFLNASDYETQGTRVQMNPPLRTHEDNAALFQGLLDGSVDFIGTDHAPHTLDEKTQPYGSAPSGVPGVGEYFSLLLNQASLGNISLKRIVELTRTNIQKIFRLPSNDDFVIVDRACHNTLKKSDLKTKCRWSPYEGMELVGRPVYTVLKGKVFTVTRDCSPITFIK